jgi:hypothetical protein
MGPLNFLQSFVESGTKEGPDYEAQQVCGRADHRGNAAGAMGDNDDVNIDNPLCRRLHSFDGAQKSRAMNTAVSDVSFITIANLIARTLYHVQSR